MSQMLLSINPEHVENILLGTKRFEFRKVRCKYEVSKIIIYATAPVSYTHLDVYKRQLYAQAIDKVGNESKVEKFGPYYYICLLYTSRCV